VDSWNVIELAEGKKTEGTHFYPPLKDGEDAAPGGRHGKTRNGDAAAA